MSRLLCCLCNCDLGNEEYDLQKTNTSISKTSLLNVLQTCIVKEFFVTNQTVCKMCFNLLDELDCIRLRAKTIEHQLQIYLSKYQTRNELLQKNSELEDCTVCGKKISSKDFKNHLKTHQSDMNVLDTNFDFDEINSISEINPSFGDMSLLNSDESTGKNDIVNNTEKKILANVKKKTPDKIKPYSCSECPKTWKTLNELKNHMTSHNNEKPYICEICGQAYKRQQALTVHVGMHKGINPFTCIYCNKSFTQKVALARHTRIHTGELPFQCDLCGKRFVHHTSFNIHRLSHTGEKSYKCEICGLSLISGSHLKRHMRVHTGEKRFSCNTCGKKFAEKYNLAVHEKLHLGISKKKKYQYVKNASFQPRLKDFFRCTMCDNFYNGQVKLEEHLLKVHQKIQYSNESEVT